MKKLTGSLWICWPWSTKCRVNFAWHDSVLNAAWANGYHKLSSARLAQPSDWRISSSLVQRSISARSFSIFRVMPWNFDKMFRILWTTHWTQLSYFFPWVWFWVTSGDINANMAYCMRNPIWGATRKLSRESFFCLWATKCVRVPYAKCHLSNIEDLGASWRGSLLGPALLNIYSSSNKKNMSLSNGSYWLTELTIDHPLGSVPTISQFLSSKLERLGQVGHNHLSSWEVHQIQA